MANFSPSDVSLLSRKVAFNFMASPIEWIKDPITRHFLEALSLFVPLSERTVIEIIRTFHLESEEINTLVKAFIKQEGQHAVIHRQANQLIQKRHPELKHIEALYQGFLNVMSKISSKRFQAATPVAFEHFTSAISKDILRESQYWIKNHKNDVVSFLEWHCLEELEHQAVCYQAYRSQYSSPWPIILATALFWLPLTLGSVFMVQFYCLIKEKHLFNPKQVFKLAKFMWRIIRISYKGITEYRNKHFTPWSQCDVTLYQETISRLNSKKP